jgi:hypothetical protein
MMNCHSNTGRVGIIRWAWPIAAIIAVLLPGCGGRGSDSTVVGSASGGAAGTGGGGAAGVPAGGNGGVGALKIEFRVSS